MVIFLPTCGSPEKIYCRSGPLYCYSTIGSADCYASPQENQSNGLVAVMESTLHNTPAECKNVLRMKYEDK